MLIKVSTLAACLLFVTLDSMKLPAQSPLVHTADTAEKTISFKRVKDLIVELTNGSGRFSAGTNSFCVVVRDQKAMTAVVVQNVSVDFRLLVGRIQETPITVRLIHDADGHYCGSVDLGRQYYRPSNYYVFVHFMDSKGKNRKARLGLTVK